MEELSSLQSALLKEKPELPPIFNEASLGVKEQDPTSSVADEDAIQRMFQGFFGKKTVTFEKGEEQETKKLTVGVILSGGQAPGGHNVIAGLYDALEKANSENRLLGFLGGPSGLIEGKYEELTRDVIDEYINTGGFDIIGSGRTKLESRTQFEKVTKVCKSLGVNAVVVIGGDDSNTNAATLAQYMVDQNTGISVIGVPKTIDGDLKNEVIETSFGFDTAAKVYSELIGNILRDANSAKKYWHFVKLMGRSASHIALEVALQTHPTVTIISEEVLEKSITLEDLVDDLCKTIIKRSVEGKNFGVVLIPEGLIEFIPEMKILISELNNILAENETYYKSLKSFEDQTQFINSHLSKESSFVFSSLPAEIQDQILADRDDHGNVSVSRIETDKLLVDLCSMKLNELKGKGDYHGSFSALTHFFGYEGRCAFPSLFDAKYTYSLGFSAFHLINNGLTGYMASIRNTYKPTSEWVPGGVPLTMMMNMEERKGQLKPVIQKALVDLDGNPFKVFQENREKWAIEDLFRFPGPIQFYGPKEVCDQPSITLKLEKSK